MPRCLPLRLLETRLDRKLRRLGWLTFDGWRRRGRQVVKGSKARQFNSLGKALFNEAQTYELHGFSPDDCEGYDDWGGPDGPWGNQ